MKNLRLIQRGGASKYMCRDWGEKHPGQHGPAERRHTTTTPLLHCRPSLSMTSIVSLLHGIPSSVTRVNCFFLRLAQIRLGFAFMYPALKCVCSDKATTGTSCGFKASGLCSEPQTNKQTPLPESVPLQNTALAPKEACRKVCLQKGDKT